MQILLSLLLLFPYIQKTIFDNSEFIKWDKNRPLTWNDFLASPKTNSSVVATTSTQVSIEFFKKNNTLTYRITCRFAKKESWVAVKNDHILKHEQGHFDIAEIFARKLNKAIREHIAKNPGNIKDIDLIYKNLMDQKDHFQNRYDEETQHSIDKMKQEAWLEKIQKLLNDLNEYSNYDQNKP